MTEEAKPVLGTTLTTTLTTSAAVVPEDQDQHLLALWSRIQRDTASPSGELGEQIRLILEPTLVSKLRGDYRTGKRLNMKKIIPYIASQYRKDKIWLRRTKPAKREYQILLAIDNTRSMQTYEATGVACATLAVLARAMTQIDIGQLAIASLGSEFRMLHEFGAAWSDTAALNVLRQFTFADESAHDSHLLEKALSVLSTARLQQMSGSSGSSSSSSKELLQVMFIISDGRILDGNRPMLTSLLRKAQDQRQMVVYVIVDHPEESQSILSLQRVSISPQGQVSRIRFMDAFPFPFYIILRDVKSMPRVLSEALKQWLELYADRV